MEEHVEMIRVVTDGTVLGSRVLDSEGNMLKGVQKVSITFEVGEDLPTGEYIQVVRGDDGKVVVEEEGLVRKTVQCEEVLLETKTRAQIELQWPAV